MKQGNNYVAIIQKYMKHYLCTNKKILAIIQIADNEIHIMANTDN